MAFFGLGGDGRALGALRVSKCQIIRYIWMGWLTSEILLLRGADELGWSGSRCVDAHAVKVPLGRASRLRYIRLHRDTRNHSSIHPFHKYPEFSLTKSDLLRTHCPTRRIDLSKEVLTESRDSDSDLDLL